MFETFLLKSERGAKHRARLKCCGATTRRNAVGKNEARERVSGDVFLPHHRQNPMKKEVSIVLSSERKNYRKLAQEWFGLTDEQMKDCDVHHNPPRHQGGRNIPEHLFIYHYTLHAAIHEASFILWRKEAAVMGGQATRDYGLGIFSLSPEERSARSHLAGSVARDKKAGIHGATPEERKEWSAKALSVKFRCLVTGHISNGAGLSSWQRARGIDTSLKERVE